MRSRPPPLGRSRLLRRTPWSSRPRRTDARNGATIRSAPATGTRTRRGHDRPPATPAAGTGSLVEWRGPLHERPQPGQVTRGTVVDLLPGGEGLGVELEAVAVGQHPLSRDDRASHHELGNVARGSGSRLIDEIALIRRGPQLKPAAAPPGLCRRHGSSLLYVQCTSTMKGRQLADRCVSPGRRPPLDV